MTGFQLKEHLPTASQLIFGCMGLGGHWDSDSISNEDIIVANEAVDSAIEAGITVFDHADIYSQTKAETVFGTVLKSRPKLRDQMILQTKCGIRFDDHLGPKRYDASTEWVTSSVEGSLNRLGIEQLDILLLHRPDPLMEIREFSDGLNSLKRSGKVLHFGVSNMHAYQIALLQSELDSPIVANQMELSLAKRDWIDEGLYAGNAQGAQSNWSAGTIEFCQSNGIQLQSWGSLAQGLYSGRTNKNASEADIETSALVAQLSEKYTCSLEAIVLAWLLRHPSNMQAVIGTTQAHRISACAEATNISLSREDWYALYVSARGVDLP